ncbi:MAG: methyltransferase, partial [Candidatus Electrothrix sp. EH2]|nr:methyltransferase [Candidatus Electrothrix sp. EH2]
MKLAYAELAAALTGISEAVSPMSDEYLLQGETAVLEPLFRQLDSLAALDVETGTVDKVLHSEDLSPALAEISRLRNLYNLRLEIEQAHALLDTSEPWKTIQG